MDLQQLRTEIDRIDNALFSLIAERRDVIEQVACYKKEHDIPVFDPQREKEVLDRLSGLEGGRDRAALRLLYGILMDVNKLYEYQEYPKELTIPTGLGGASVRAILPDIPGSLCRYLSPLAAAEISVTGISSRSMPGGKLVVDLELVGDCSNPNFAAALSVLSDTAERFTLL